MRRPSLRILTAGAAAAAVTLLGAGTAQATPFEATQTKLTHADAASRFESAGITWSSSGGCSDRNTPTCTSFEQVNLATVQGAETLKSASGCALNVTGGTETGHADGTYSHWNGYKLDFSLSDCLTSYVQNTFTSIGGSKWESASGNVYYLESNHWDVTFHNCGGC
ncbi:hypothetical protein [Prauserella rugosa]|uniref:Peptidase M15-like protein n=1 Tax=Prauserella rugosa TaxID=43354 RepID=A0A660CFY4_9PSEU|nr:hypothetical protein [Prauserella rugosa]TWH22352.1 hypothetical protein JD82_04229 [Prauserella rugosa]